MEDEKGCSFALFCTNLRCIARFAVICAFLQGFFWCPAATVLDRTRPMTAGWIMAPASDLYSLQLRQRRGNAREDEGTRDFSFIGADATENRREHG